MWAKYKILNKSDLPKLIYLLEGAATSYKIEKISWSQVFFSKS